MIELLPVHGLPEVTAGTDLAALLAGAAPALRDGDVVVVSQKIVSKAEGATVALAPGEDVTAARQRLARREAVRVVAEAPWALVVETRHGLVCANAGIDASNTPAGTVTLLPEDPDASARRLRAGLAAVLGVDVAVIVADTFGRPWRLGQTDVAIGCAGLDPVRDERGSHDREGRVLEVTQTAVADELAGAADLVRRKADGVPAVIVRGFAFAPAATASARDLVRPAALDLFARGRGGLADEVGGRGEPMGPVPTGDLERALAGARRVAGAEIVAEATAGQYLTTVRLHGDGAAVAAGVLVAALDDLGHAARWLRASGSAGTMVVEAGIGSRTGAGLGR